MTNPYLENTLKNLNLFGIQTCVESGTHRGFGTLEFCKFFEEVHTIEISAELCEYCRGLFAGNPHITLYEGSSVDKLPGILEKIDDPYLLFLDSHFSQGDTSYDPRYGPSKEYNRIYFPRNQSN